MADIAKLRSKAKGRVLHCEKTHGDVYCEGCEADRALLAALDVVERLGAAREALMLRRPDKHERVEALDIALSAFHSLFPKEAPTIKVPDDADRAWVKAIGDADREKRRRGEYD